MALSRDGHVLAAANGIGATIFDTARLISGKGDPVLGYLNDGPASGSVYVAFSPDDHSLFVSDERSQSLSVYDFTATSGGKRADRIGQIPTGEAPVGLAFSPDGRLLYGTSEIVPGNSQICSGEGTGPEAPSG